MLTNIKYLFSFLLQSELTCRFNMYYLDHKTISKIKLVPSFILKVLKAFHECHLGFRIVISIDADVFIFGSLFWIELLICIIVELLIVDAKLTINIFLVILMINVGRVKLEWNSDLGKTSNIVSVTVFADPVIIFPKERK